MRSQWKETIYALLVELLMQMEKVKDPSLVPDFQPRIHVISTPLSLVQSQRRKQQRGPYRAGQSTSLPFLLLPFHSLSNILFFYWVFILAFF